MFRARWPEAPRPRFIKRTSLKGTFYETQEFIRGNWQTKLGTISCDPVLGRRAYEMTIAGETDQIEVLEQ